MSQHLERELQIQQEIQHAMSAASATNTPYQSSFPAVQEILDLCQRILESQQKTLEEMERIAAYVRPEGTES